MIRARRRVATGVPNSVGQLPHGIADEDGYTRYDTRALAPTARRRAGWLQGGLGPVEPDLSLAVVLKASEGLERQEGLVRGAPVSAGELTDAVGLASRTGVIAPLPR